MQRQRASWYAGTLLTAIVALLVMTKSAMATQHLVSPGDRWELFAKKAAPGDEIILMPGKHRAANLYGLCGKPGKPIVVRGVNAENPAIIVADRYGLRLHQSQYVHLKNIIITDATLCGLVIDDAPANKQMTIISAPLKARSPESDESADADDADKPFRPGFIQLTNVEINKTGPEGNRDAIKLAGVHDITFDSCSIGGWAGTAVHIAGCSQVRFRNCQFVGRPDHTQKSIARIGGGSKSVHFNDCRFEHSLKNGIVIGAAMDEEAFRPPLTERSRKVFAADDVRVHQSLFIDCAVPVTFGDAAHCSVFGCTFVRPRRHVFHVQSQTTDKRFAPAKELRFGTNLIVWEPGDLTRLCRVVGAYKDRTFEIGVNLWWSPESEEERAKHGELPGKRQVKQVTSIDPALDENMQPIVMTARSFGRRGEVAEAKPAEVTVQAQDERPEH